MRKVNTNVSTVIEEIALLFSQEVQAILETKLENAKAQAKAAIVSYIAVLDGYVEASVLEKYSNMIENAGSVDEVQSILFDLTKFLNLFSYLLFSRKQKHNHNN